MIKNKVKTVAKAMLSGMAVMAQIAAADAPPPTDYRKFP